MPSINDILNNLGVEEEKTASKNPSESEIEKQAKALGLVDGADKEGNTKVASAQPNGGTMLSLEELYNAHFPGEEAEKVASAKGETPTESLTKEAALEVAGEQAGLAFADGLQERLLDFTVKLAAEGDVNQDSEATKEIQSGPGVIPGAKTDNPMLPVNKNREQADDKPIDTSPDYYSLQGMDGALAKARLESMLSSNNVEAVTNTNKNVDTGLETPASQKDA